MKKDRFFYNILFPIWFFLFIPSTWLFLITFLGNAAIDSLVLALGCKMIISLSFQPGKRAFLGSLRLVIWRISSAPQYCLFSPPF